MKTIFVVTFLGILPYAYTRTFNCSEEFAMLDFQPEKFFKERWYLGHGSPITPPGVCQAFHTDDPKGVTLFVESGYKKFESKGISGKFICNGGKKNEEQYSFKCQSEECGVENSDYEVDLKILSTDYYSSALICKSITFANGEKEDNFHTFERTLRYYKDHEFC
uniref:Salivary triabin 1 n=1 Tax=Triatoma brasiliensis TaxID=65344 RepID=Q0MTE4_TRIBS|nr:salivary triabin 1 [Triatoma brasiliensis]